MIIDRALGLLRCPGSGERLRAGPHELVSAGGEYRYRVNEAGIPLFAETALSPEAGTQRDH